MPEELEKIVMRCLEKEPTKRPQSAREVVDALVRLRSQLRDSDRVQKLSIIHRGSVVAQRPVLSRLIGREKEFGELQRRLNQALQNECQFAVIGGEAGVGKSRLLDELENLARARKLRVLHSRFVEQEQAFPYQAFCEAIQDYFRLKITTGSGPIDLSDLAGDLVSLFPVLAEVDEISGKHKPAPLGEAKKIQDRTYIYDLLARSFIRIGAGKPIVLFFEDLHNADVSLDALQYVVRRLGATPTLIVGTYRSTEVDKNHPLVRMLKSFQGDRRFAQLQLEPFTLDEHRAFLQTLIGSEDLEEGFVEKLYEATEGNPHFIRELVRSLIDSERIVKTDTGVWNLSGETALSSDVLPPTIQETVEKRIERLPQEWKEILSIASIPGRTFEFHDLEMLSGSKDLDDIVDGLISAGFVEEQRGSRGDVLTFSSGIVRDVLYAELPRRRRRTLHRKYAEELEKRFAGRLESVYPLLLHHYSEGDVPEKVIHFGVEQIKKSLDAFSTEDALRAAKTVLEFLHAESSVATELEGNVRMLIASAYRMGGNIDSALRELESAIRIFEQHASHAEVLAAVVATAETAWEGRRIEETREWVQVGIDLAHKSSASNEILGQLLSLGATVANLRGEYDLAKGYLEEAERLKPVEKQAQETVIKGGSLTVALPNAVAASIPVNLNTTEEAEILSVVFETLLGMDEQGHLIPSLSEEWKVLEEGKCFSFRLRSPVTLHDGQLLTAAKAKAALEKAIRTGRDRLAAALAAIRGVSDFLNGASDEVAGIIVESEQELRIELEEPLPIYPGLLTDPRASIVFPADSKLPVGTGPFRMKSFEPNRVILERNDAHWKEPPHLDALQFRCGVASAEIAAGLKSGELDLGGNLLSDDLEEILQDRWRRPTLVEVPKKNVYFILFNTKSPYFRTEEVRIALGGTLRVHDLVRSTLGRFAQPAEGFLPPGILGHDPGRRRQPLPDAKVKGLLEESGLQLPLGLKAAVHPLFQDRYAALTNAVLKVWANFQVQFTSETPNMTTFLDSWVKNAGQFDLLIGRWNADYDDPDNFMYVLFDSELGEFRQYFSSPEFDRMIEEARIENSPAVREKMYRKLESYLIEKGYVIPLFHEIDYRVATPSVRGLTLSSRAPFVNYPKIWKSQGPSVSTARKTGGGVIHVPMSAMTNDLNPATAVSRATIESIWNIFDTLTRQVEGARIVPWLASSFHAEEGGRWYRFRLRDDIRFHDGRRLTARDVRYTFERLFQTEDSIRGMYFCIRGSQDLAAGKTKELEGFRIHSAHEFTIELEERLSFFPALLANAASCIVPEGLKELKGTWRDGFVGTGAFRVIRWEPGKRLELEANPNYWRPGYPKCEGIVFHYNVPPKEIYSGFRSGKYSLASDLILSDAENLRHDPEFASGYKEIPFLSTYFIVLNSRKGPLSDLQMRQSLIDKIDVAGLTRKHTGRLGLPAHSLIPPGLLGYEKRRKLGGKEAPGQPKSLSGLNLHLVLHSVYRGPYSELAEDMVRSFEEKGVSCDVGQEVVEQLIAQGEFHSASPDIVFIRWFNDYPDADSFYHTLLHSKKGVLGFLCGSPELDRLIERGRMETDPNVRHQIYQEAEQLIARQTLLLPLFHEQTYRIARPEVQDLQLLISADTVAYEKLYVSR